MDTYEAIWTAMRMDRYTYDTWSMIASASLYTFEYGEALHAGIVQRSHLLGAALYYDAPCRCIRLICDNITNAMLLKEGWDDLIMVRVPKEKTLCFVDSVDSKSTPKRAWFELVIRREHRFWFWDEIVRGQWKKISSGERELLRTYALERLCDFPLPIQELVREIMDLPSGAE